MAVQLLMMMITIMMLWGLNRGNTSVMAQGWRNAHATFYGSRDGTQDMGGACGFPSMYSGGYGVKNTALSTALFNSGASCGACFQIYCDEAHEPQWCLPGRPAILVTATNFCPPNWTLPNDNGGWCNPPLEHFDLAMPSFLSIAHYKAGIVPVIYRRANCARRNGGVVFRVAGRDYFELFNFSNVGGPGDVVAAWIKGSGSSTWEALHRNWGANWQSNSYLKGQALSFLLMTSDRRTLAFINVVPSSWRVGQSFKSSQNFL